MSTPKKSSRSNVMQFAQLTRTKLRFSPNPSLEVFRLKAYSPDDLLFAIFPQVFKTPESLDKYHGESFPKDISSIFLRNPLYKPTTIIRELIWSICRCIQNYAKLNRFCTLRESFERAIVLNDKLTASQSLEEIEAQLGTSLWLVQAKFILARHWGGIAELQKLAEGYRDGNGIRKLTKTLIWFFRIRTEATADTTFLRTELSKVLADHKGADLDIYCKTKLFDLADPTIDNIPATLFIESQSSVIDLYETLVHLLQGVASASSVPASFSTKLRQPLRSLGKLMGDKRIENILRSICQADTNDCVPDPIRAAAIEAYTMGDYVQASSAALQALHKDCMDMSMFVLLHKAAVRANLSLPSFNGVLSNISSALRNILTLTEDAYISVTEMIRLSGLFYGQQWANYIRAASLYEIRNEERIFPPLWLRDLFIRDIGTSPFSAVAMLPENATIFLQSASLKHAFPHTLSVYQIITNGRSDKADHIDLERHCKYLARYHLAFGDVKVALKIYQAIMASAHGVDAVRASGGAALALASIGRTSDAAEVIVSAYFSHPHVPTCLPIKEVVTSLGPPSEWSESIAIPLILELYLEYRIV